MNEIPGPDKLKDLYWSKELSLSALGTPKLYKS